MKNNRLYKISFHSLLVAGILSISISCSSEEAPMDLKEKTSTISEVVTLTQRQFDLGDMKIGSLSEIKFSKSIKANGMFDVPPENKSTVSAYFGGYVTNIQLLPGQSIKKGQSLFSLENPDYIQVQQDYLEAKSQMSYLKMDYERQKDLAKDNISSQKTFSKAESDFKMTSVRIASLSKRLGLMGINSATLSEANIRTTIAVLSPISGYITEVNAQKGMFLNPSDVALTIMNIDHIHLELKIFEKDLQQVKVGQVVKFHLLNDPTEYLASVYLINKAIDPIKRTVNIHCHLANDQMSQFFTPGMFVEAEISTNSRRSPALPTSAIVNVEDAFFVLKLIKKGKTFEFKRIEVQLGEVKGEFTEILNSQDLQIDGRYLLNGAYNLINE